jgi:hypothetical protein
MKIKKSKLLEIFKQHNLSEGFLDDVLRTLSKLQSKVDSVKTKSKINILKNKLDKLDDDPSVMALFKQYDIEPF